MHIISLKDVSAKTGLSKATIYRLLKREVFPEPLMLTNRRVGWVESHIDEWIQSRIILGYNPSDRRVKIKNRSSQW